MANPFEQELQRRQSPSANPFAAELQRRSGASSPPSSPSQATQAPQPTQPASPLGQGNIFPETVLSDLGASARPEASIPEMESAVNEFFASPEGQRILLEAAGGTALSLANPPAGMLNLLRVFGPRVGPFIARGIQAGVGEAGGSVAAEQVDPSESPAASAARAFATGALAEGTGNLLIGAGGKILRPFAKQVEEGLQPIIDRLRAEGGVVTPGIASTSRVIDIAEEIAESSLIGGGRIQATKANTEEIAQGLVEDFAERMAGRLPRDEAGEVLQGALEESSTAFRALQSRMYSNVDELAEGAVVDFAPVIEEAARLFDRAGKGVKSGSRKTVLRSILRKEDTLSFEEAQLLRSDLLAVGRGGTDILPGRAQGEAKRLAGMIDRQMEEAAKQLDNEALDAWRRANAVTREGKATFNARLIKSLAQKDPEEVMTTLLRAGKPTNIKRVRQILLGELPKASKEAAALGEDFVPNPDAWRAIQGEFVETILRKGAANSPVAGRIDGKAALKELNRFGSEFLREILPAEQANALRTSLNALRVSQKPIREGAGGGGMLIQLVQGGAVLDLGLTIVGAGALPAGSAAVLLGPAAVGRLMTTKRGAKWLTEGLRAPPGSADLTRAAAQISGVLVSNGFREEAEAIASKFGAELGEFLRGNNVELEKQSP